MLLYRPEQNKCLGHVMTEEIQKLEQELYQLTGKLNQLKQKAPAVEVQNYQFQTQSGETCLLDLFGDRDKLLVIHNMGQGCRYCTLWADGINGFLPHLESAMSVVLVSKDGPEEQRRFANERGWRFRLASHGGGSYMQEQSVMASEANAPGAAFYERDGKKIMKRNTAVFGPGDLYCSFWNLLGLAGLTEKEWTPQYQYWKRPQSLDDGGQNIQE